ncbi:glycosyl transferase family 1 [Mycobacterium sp. E1386]|uniref:glycosyltransferase family 4 protein n=1 Tax=unclassified Mycobacterium TaxID=2642494 RepID=UPI000800648E|nr:MULTISPECIES: glycosyltransferase family 4 protein [unclassified Mycobacterium]OBI36809.1 glycosyl transferase family 1 [Mycobacterium sp. E2238]OBI37848.1 glycosyl transferase family 1 [Mycobacterium sp. E1386]
MKRELDRQYLKGPVGGAAGLPPVRPLAVLIVAGCGPDTLEGCLAGVAEQLPGLAVYVYATGDCRKVAARHPWVHLVSGAAKVGFAEAFNALVGHAPSDADLLLLDVRVRLLGPLTRTRELLRGPRVAAVSPMARGDTTPGWAPWDVATRRRTLVRELAAGRRRGSPFSRRYARQPPESEGVEGELDPTCLAINRAAWNTVGGFDEEFSGVAAAADWQARARAAGWRMLLADEIGVEGAGLGDEESTAAEPRRERDLARADTALLLEHQHSVHHADAYLAGTTLLRSRRSLHGGRRKDLPAIVITTNRLVYGGAERQKALLATELDSRGYSVTIVCVQRFGPMIAEIPDTVRVVRQPWWAPVVDIPEGPAVLITADTNTEAGFASLWRAGAAGRRWLVAPHVPPEQDRPIYSRPLTAAMRRADGFIVLAQRHWDMLVAQHRLWGRHFVAPNGVALAGDPAPRVRTAGDPLHLVMLSRIVEHKNPHLLIEALGELPDMPWRLSVFGDGPDRERLQALTPAGLRDRVQWRGWSAGPGPALADADLLCVPSRSEAFPLVILEAMARAVPVAASAICAVPEMLDFGRAGFLVEPVSVVGWRESLARILAEPDALPPVGRRGFERMRKHYTVEAMTDAYLEAINAVL